MNFDFLKNLRLQNIFNPQNPTPMGTEIYNPTVSNDIYSGEPVAPTFQGSFNPEGMGQPNPMQQPKQGGLSSIAERMAQMFQPQNESINRYNEMIDQYPERPQPGNLRKVGAVALASLGDLFGPQGSGKLAFSEMMGYGGHERKVADWKNQVEPLERSANIERQANANQRTAAYQTITAELRQEAQDAKAANDLRRAAIAEQRARVYEFKARNPNARFIMPRGGNIQAIHPQTGQVIATLGSTGTMSEEDRLAMLQEFNLEQIEARGNEAEQLEGVRADNRATQSATDAEEAEALERLRQQGRPGNRELPTQTRVRQYTAARELANTDPELAEFIEFGPGANDFSIVGNPSILQRRKIQDTIYGSDAPNPTITSPNISRVPSGNRQPSFPFNRGNESNMSTIPRTNVPPPTQSTRPTAPTGRPMISNARNKRTGEIRPMISYDGGKSWSPYDASVQP